MKSKQSATNDKLPNHPEPFLKVELGLEQPPLAFGSLDELESWVENEKSEWEWFVAAQQAEGALQSIWSSTRETWQQFRNAIAEMRRDKLVTPTSSLKNAATRLHSQGLILVSQDPRAVYAKSIGENDPARGGAMVWAWADPRQAVRQPIGVRGYIDAMLFDQGIPDDRLSAIVTSFDRYQQQWQEQEDRIAAQYSAAGSNNKSQSEAVTKFLEQQTESFEKLYESSSNRLDAITDTYDKKLALQAPVDYWKTKVETHRQRVHTLIRLVGLATAVSIAAIVVLLIFLLIPTLDAAGTDNPPLWPLALLVASLGLAAWPIRLLSKLLLSNIHLQTDAEERVTMANAYLAIVRDESNDFPEAERQFILDVLFRSSSTGIVKDEGPSTPIEAVVKNIK